MPFSDTQSKALSAKLSAKYVKTREGAGRTLSYLEGWHIIAEANRIFGFDAWDRETVAARCVWEGVSKGLNACSYVARVKVRVRAGETVIVREGSGSGVDEELTAARERFNMAVERHPSQSDPAATILIVRNVERHRTE